jgi:hypothetical protein
VFLGVDSAKSRRYILVTLSRKAHRKATNQRRSESRRVQEYHEAKGRTFRYRNDPAMNSTRVQPAEITPTEDTPRVKRLKVMHPTGPQLRWLADLEEQAGIEADPPESRWEASERINAAREQLGIEQAGRSRTEERTIRRSDRKRETQQHRLHATKKQVNFLRDLYERAGETPPAWLETATERKGSMSGCNREIRRLQQKLHDQKETA